MSHDLCSPLDLGEVRLRSRLLCGAAAWSGGAAPPSPATLAAAASGITGAVAIRVAVRGDGASSAAELALDDASSLDLLAQRVRAIQAQGAVALVELTHGGPRSGDHLPTRPLGPVAETDPCNGRTPRALSDAELDDVIEAFIRAGERARAVGAALLGLEVADGALLHAYLSARCRGGRQVDVPARVAPARHALEGLRALAPVLVTLCTDDLCPGATTASEGVAAAVLLADAGAAGLVVVGGGRSVPHLRRPRRPPGPLREGPHARLASWARRAVQIPVGTAGGLRSRESMDRLIGDGVIDLAVLERPFAAERTLGVTLAQTGAHARCTSGMDCLQAAPCDPARGRCPADCPQLVARAGYAGAGDVV